MDEAAGELRDEGLLPLLPGVPGQRNPDKECVRGLWSVNKVKSLPFRRNWKCLTAEKAAIGAHSQRQSNMTRQRTASWRRRREEPRILEPVPVKLLPCVSPRHLPPEKSWRRNWGRPEQGLRLRQIWQRRRRSPSWVFRRSPWGLP